MSVAERAVDARNRRPPREKRMPVYVVRSRSTDERSWVTIGAAWERKHGEDGFTIRLHALPLTGTLVLLPPLPNDEIPEGEPPDDRSDERIPF